MTRHSESPTPERPADGPAGEGGARHNPWLILITVSLGFFMTLLDTAIVNVAIPQMTVGLHASLTAILWVLNGYTLAFTVLLLISGKIGERYGRRDTFIVSLAVFVVASALCGLSQNPGELIAMRVVQGIGAAAMMPQTLAIVTDVFPEERRGAAFGVWSAVAGAATIVAPIVGGVLVTYESWRWIFFLNLPIGIAAFVMALICLPRVRLHEHPSLDPVGVSLSTVALVGIAYGLIDGQRYGWGAIWSFVSIPLVMAVGAVAFCAFLYQQRLRQDRQPLVPFALFRDRDFAVMSFVTATIVFGSTGLLLPLMIYFQSVLGLSAVATGLTLVPMTVVILILAPVGGILADRIGGAYILTTGIVLMAGGLALIVVAVQPDSSRWALLPGLLVAGFGTGLVFAPMNAVAMRRVRPELAGPAAAIISTSRQLGITIGTAAVGALLQNRLVSTLTSEAQQRATVLPANLRVGFVRQFHDSAASGLQVGVGETGARALPGVSGALAAQVERVSTEVFAHGFVSALRPTLLLPVAVVMLGAVCTLFLRHERPARPGPDERADAAQEHVAGRDPAAES
jgi:EmrB/QacA subfamily drug resistance transporter